MYNGSGKPSSSGAATPNLPIAASAFGRDPARLREPNLAFVDGTDKTCRQYDAISDLFIQNPFPAARVSKPDSIPGSGQYGIKALCKLNKQRDDVNSPSVHNSYTEICN
jgi:hypothetical protein